MTDTPAPDTIVFRRAQREDLPALVAMLADDDLGRTREGRADPPDPGYVAAFERIDASPDNLLLVMEDASGRLLGQMQLTFLPGLSHKGLVRGQIEGVRIVSDRRGQGLGERFIRHAMDVCRDRGCGVVQLTTTKSRVAAQRFYARLGFVASHEGMKATL